MTGRNCTEYEDDHYYFRRYREVTGNQIQDGADIYQSSETIFLMHRKNAERTVKKTEVVATEATELSSYKNYNRRNGNTSLERSRNEFRGLTKDRGRLHQLHLQDEHGDKKKRSREVEIHRKVPTKSSTHSMTVMTAGHNRIRDDGKWWSLRMTKRQETD